MPTIPFGQWYVSESLPIANQDLFNFYLKMPQTTSVTEQVLFSTPGIKSQLSAAANERGRGFHVFNGVPYTVNGTTLYRIDRTYNAFGVPVYALVDVSGGTPIPGTGRLFIADNGAEGGQICIAVPEGTNQFNAYIYTIAGGLVQISDADFDGPVNGLVYNDGYFVFSKKTSNNFFISNLRDGLNYIATDFGSAEADPDTIQVPFVLAGELFVFGTQTIQAFQNVGGAGFPYASIEGSVVEKGTQSPYSLIELDGYIVWIGSSVNEQAAIWRSSGGKPEKISTPAIDNELRKYSDAVIASAFSVKYSQSGALFAVFTFPGERSFVFDSINSAWHVRESYNNAVVNYRVSHIADAYGELWVNDVFTNGIGTIDKEIYTEYGVNINRGFTLPPVDNEGQPFHVDSVEIVGNTGNGLATGQGSDPIVLMSFSSNSGRTFSDTMPTDFGEIGEYDTRAIWTQLGQFQRSVMFRFSVSDPVNWQFSKVEINFD